MSEATSDSGAPPLQRRRLRDRLNSLWRDRKALFNRSCCSVSVKDLCVVFLISIGIYFAEIAGFLSAFENYSLDALLRLHAGSQSERIVLVTIDNADYEAPEYFNGRSPLRSDLVFDAIERISRGNPSVIAVDLDTSDSTFVPSKSLPSNAVFAVGIMEDDASNSQGAVVPLKVLGADLPPRVAPSSSEAASVRTGLAAFPVDRDGVVRRMWLKVPVREQDASNTAPSHELDSFPLAIVRKHCESQDQDGASDPKLKQTSESLQDESGHGDHLPAINYSSRDASRFPVIPLRQLLKESQKPEWATGRIHNKIVIFGGVYRAARDRYATPVGIRSGIVMVAEAVEALSERRLIRPINHVFAIAADVILGILFVMIEKRFRFKGGKFVGALVITVLAVLGCVIVYNSLVLLFNFMAVLIGTSIHLMISSDHSTQHPHA